MRNLFFNVPVRRNFLKSTTTEINYISEFVTKIALAYPTISFSLNHNDKSLISAPKGNLLTQITAVFGEKIAKACISLKGEENNYNLSGFITLPEFSRKSKDYLYIYVNNRPISSILISDAILSGYGTAIPQNRFPIVFVFLDLPTNEVDVNVHPTKKEVRFSNESKIFGLIESTVTKSLKEEGLKVFERVSEVKTKPTLLQDSIPKKGKTQGSPISSIPSIEKQKLEEGVGFEVIKSRDLSIDQFMPESESRMIIEKTPLERKRRIRVLGIVKDTYIIAETKEGLLLCDQHAAHEKINYIKYLQQLNTKRTSIQQLLAPVSVSLKPSEFQLIDEIKNKLKNYGFEIDIFGSNEIIIRSIPSIMGVTISFEVAKDIIDIIKEHNKEIKDDLVLNDFEFIKDLISLFSCRRSIKAGDKISIREAEVLISELLELDDPFTCPHGRPTIIILNDKYVEELFQRDYR